MNKLLLALLLMMPVLSQAQRTDNGPLLTRDSLYGSNRFAFIIDKGWRFIGKDSAAMAQPAYNDAGWDSVSCELRIGDNPGKRYDSFNSIGWFRYHFNADTSIVNMPISVCMTQFGASEIYLDGKIMDSLGTIADKAHTTDYDPQRVPFIMLVPSAGPHVIAVRYANYNAQYNYYARNRNFGGFKMYIGLANSLIWGSSQYSKTMTFGFMLLFGFFIALCFLHLFLFLYDRKSKANAYFSAFCLSLAVVFFIAYMNTTSHHPDAVLKSVLVDLAAAMTAAISASGFTNDLFSRDKRRFRLIILLCISTFFIYPLSKVAGIYAYLTSIFLVSAEAIILTLRAMVRKVKGARILGVGVLSFGILILGVFIASLFGKNLELNDTDEGIFMTLITAFAVLSLPISMSVFLAWKFSNLNRELETQLVQVQTLSEQALQQEQEKKRMLEDANESLERQVTARTEEIVAQKDRIEKQHGELKVEKKKSDDLLLNILPEEIAEELKQKGRSDAKYFDEVTVLFTDFVDFTKAGETLSPSELVSELNICFKEFDEIISKYGIEKIKTIGDAYMAVCGLPQAQTGHAERVVYAALDILEFMRGRREVMGDRTFDIRIGIHSGSVVAGIVGVKKFAYDIWGDTVNTAARIEQNSEPGRINISQTVFDQVRGKFECTSRGEIIAKNKGGMHMYFVERALTVA